MKASKQAARPARVYLSTPIDQFSHPAYQQARNRVLARFPGCELVEAARMGWNQEEWEVEWPALVPGMGAVVVWPREDFTITRDVWQEVSDAQEFGVPVFVLTHGGGWHQRSDLALLDNGTAREWARVVCKLNT